jgi:hypothetical protein
MQQKRNLKIKTATNKEMHEKKIEKIIIRKNNLKVTFFRKHVSI